MIQRSTHTLNLLALYNLIAKEFDEEQEQELIKQEFLAAVEQKAKEWCEQHVNGSA